MNDQLQIRSCLENHKGDYKVYFCSSGVSKLQNIESLCRVIQIKPPSKEQVTDHCLNLSPFWSCTIFLSYVCSFILQIIKVLEFIANCEGIELPPRLAENIAEESKHSIQQAIRSFEATWQLK